jgi:hypothetical protein
MFNSDGRPKGYEYPLPSTAGVTVRWEPDRKPQTLSHEDAAKVREAVEKTESVAPKKA